MKARALTEMVYVDEIDVDQEGIAEMILDENAIAQVPRKCRFFSSANEMPLGGGNLVFTNYVVRYCMFKKCSWHSRCKLLL